MLIAHFLCNSNDAGINIIPCIRNNLIVCPIYNAPEGTKLDSPEALRKLWETIFKTTYDGISITNPEATFTYVTSFPLLKDELVNDAEEVALDIHIIMTTMCLIKDSRKKPEVGSPISHTLHTYIRMILAKGLKEVTANESR